MNNKIQEKSMRGTWNLIIDLETCNVSISFDPELLDDRGEIDHLGSVLEMLLHDLARKRTIS